LKLLELGPGSNSHQGGYLIKSKIDLGFLDIKGRGKQLRP